MEEVRVIVLVRDEVELAREALSVRSTMSLVRKKVLTRSPRLMRVILLFR